MISLLAETNIELEQVKTLSTWAAGIVAALTLGWPLLRKIVPKILDAIPTSGTAVTSNTSAPTRGVVVSGKKGSRGADDKAPEGTVEYVTDIRNACKGASEKFILERVMNGETRDQAREKWIDEQNRIIREAKGGKPDSSDEFDEPTE